MTKFRRSCGRLSLNEKNDRAALQQADGYFGCGEVGFENTNPQLGMSSTTPASFRKRQIFWGFSMSASVKFLQTMVYGLQHCYSGITHEHRQQHWVEPWLTGGFHKDDVVLPPLRKMQINNIDCYSINDFEYWLASKWKPYMLSGLGPIARLKSDFAMNTASTLIIHALKDLCNAGSWRGILREPPTSYAMIYELRLCTAVGAIWFVKKYREDLRKESFVDQAEVWVGLLHDLQSEVPVNLLSPTTSSVERQKFYAQSAEIFKSNQQEMITILRSLYYG